MRDKKNKTFKIKRGYLILAAAILGLLLSLIFPKSSDANPFYNPHGSNWTELQTTEHYKLDRTRSDRVVEWTPKGDPTVLCIWVSTDHSQGGLTCFKRSIK